MSNGMMAIHAALLMVCLCATDVGLSAAQLIYPDQFEIMRAASSPSYPYGDSRQPTPLGTTYGSPRAVNAASSQNYNPGQPQYSLPPQRPPFNSVQANRAPVTYTTTAIPNNNFRRPAGSARSAPLPSNSTVQVYDSIYKGVTKFALDLNNAIKNARVTVTSSEPENVVFSPLNVASALALVLLGSSGYTFSELSRLFGFDLAQVDISQHSEIYHQMFGLLLSSLTDKSGQPGYPQITVSNGLFVQQDDPIRPEYLKLSKDVYNSDVVNLDFRLASMQAQKIINDWVNMRTMGKIPTMLAEPPNPETSVIIASALYFKGEWNQHFIDGVTRRKLFNIEPGQSVNVDMMYNGGEFPFYEDATIGAKILGLPYKGLDYTMYVILPNAQGAGALRTFESQLTVERLEYLIDRMENKTCIVGLPRMKLSSTLRLVETLRSLGVNTLFTPSMADLSVLSNRVPDAPAATPTQNSAAGQVRPGKSNDFVFPRFGEYTTESPRGTKKNHIRYRDQNGGYLIEQWSTGFYIRKEQIFGKQRSPNIETILSNNDEILNIRRKRQAQQPSNQNFIDYIASLNLRSTGLDELRNSGRLRNPGLYADEVLHKVVIDINEQGTEAAAATSVSLNRDGSQKRLLANRPFLFVIRHEPTKLILFWGSINTPTPNYPAQ